MIVVCLLLLLLVVSSSLAPCLLCDLIAPGYFSIRDVQHTAATTDSAFYCRCKEILVFLTKTDALHLCAHTTNSHRLEGPYSFKIYYHALHVRGVQHEVVSVKDPCIQIPDTRHNHTVTQVTLYSKDGHTCTFKYMVIQNINMHTLCQTMSWISMLTCVCGFILHGRALPAHTPTSLFLQGVFFAPSSPHVFLAL